MSTASDRLEVLFRTPDELEAAMIAGVLREHGLPATTVGGYTSGFRAEAPGQVRVLVAEANLEPARQLLAQTLRDSHFVDWEGVDFQDPTPIEDDEQEALPAAEAADASPHESRLQYSLSLLVLVQTVLCAIFGLWRVVLGGGDWVVGLLVFFLFSLTVSGTVYIAGNFSRFRDRWRRLGRPLTMIAVLATLLYVLGCLVAALIL